MADSGIVLLIDMGNSRIKWACSQSGELKPGEPFRTPASVDLPHFPQVWERLPRPDQILASNVAGDEAALVLQAWTRRRWGVAPQFLASLSHGYGVVNGYADPCRLGVDRWVALVGAHQGCRLASCVVDCGTAMTVDVLTAQGVHLGGMIAPGLGLMRRSLARGTSALPMVQEEGHVVLANETAGAIASGTLQAVLGLVERAFREASLRLGSEPTLFLTGGDAPVLSAALDLPHETKPYLILEGLSVISRGQP